MIFLGKRNIIFPDDTKKIMFQRNFFWEDHPFRTFGKRKYGFFSAVLSLKKTNNKRKDIYKNT